VKPTQADSEIEEEHLLNCVVNSLDEELAIDLGENVEVTTETLYGSSPAPAPAGPQSTTSAKQLTTRPTPIPSVDISPTSLSWTPLRRLGDTLLQRDTLETLPDRPVEVVADLHLDPTTVTRTRQRRCTPRRLNAEPRRFTRMRRSMRGYETSGTRWRFAS